MNDDKAGTIYVAYVLDRTGSMTAMWEETVSGFGAFVREQDSETAVTLIPFDHHGGPRMEVPFLGAPAREVAEAGIPPGVVLRGTTPRCEGGLRPTGWRRRAGACSMGSSLRGGAVFADGRSGGTYT